MSGIDPDRKLKLSVLDRLIEASSSQDNPNALRSTKVRDLKDAVRRDLEWLLNTKQSPIPLPPADVHLKKSILAYGIPDVSSMSFQRERDRARLRTALEAAIAAFEPRLKQVRVTLVEAGQADRSIRFRIDAILDVDPVPEPISYDTMLKLQSHAFEIRGDDA